MVEERNVIAWGLVSFLCCGAWIWWIQIGRDIATLRGDDRPNVLIDILLFVCTFGLWGIVAAYQWPGLLNEEIERRGGRPDRNLPTLSLLMVVFSAGIVPAILIQGELNKLANGRTMAL